MKVPTLTPEQVEYIRSKDILEEDTVPVRFQYQGYPIECLITGKVGQLGTNVMHQQVFWGFDRKTAHEIATWLGVTPIFSHKPKPDRRIKYQK